MESGQPTRPHRLLWLSMLSLDAPLFVVLARELAWPGSMSGHPADALFLGWLVWAGYAFDRWVDARAGGPGNDTWRHRFHRKHARGFLLVVLAVLAVALVLAVRAAGDDAFFAERWRWRGGLLVAGLALVGVHRWVRLNWTVRTALVAVFLGAVVAARWDGMPSLFFVFAALMVAANLAVIRRSEHPGEEPWLGWVAPVVALVGFFGMNITLGGGARMAFATCCVGLGMWIVDRRRARYSPELQRARADLITLLVLVVFLLFVR